MKGSIFSKIGSRLFSCQLHSSPISNVLHSPDYFITYTEVKMTNTDHLTLLVGDMGPAHGRIFLSVCASSSPSPRLISMLAKHARLSALKTEVPINPQNRFSMGNDSANILIVRQFFRPDLQ